MFIRALVLSLQLLWGHWVCLHSSHSVQYTICVYLSRAFLYIVPWCTLARRVQCTIARRVQCTLARRVHCTLLKPRVSRHLVFSFTNEDKGLKSTVVNRTRLSKIMLTVPLKLGKIFLVKICRRLWVELKFGLFDC